MWRKKLMELIEFAKESDLHEVVWEKKNLLIRFERSPAPERRKPSAAAPSAVPAVTGAAPEAPVEHPARSEVIRSTMVGTFYRSDSADRPPMVVEGTIVNAGQPVAAIEAMKIMKDVTAGASCRIVKALVANGHPVEYGQPLFEIEPAPQDGDKAS
jgi:acetyl-CoA carboxylase biotin carboxyl carrier protein